MNTRITTRLMSFGFAALVTLSMLGGVNALAVSEPTPDLMARVAVQPQG